MWELNFGPSKVRAKIERRRHHTNWVKKELCSAIFLNPKSESSCTQGEIKLDFNIY